MKTVSEIVWASSFKYDNGKSGQEFQKLIGKNRVSHKVNKTVKYQAENNKKLRQEQLSKRVKKRRF